MLLEAYCQQGNMTGAKQVSKTIALEYNKLYSHRHIIKDT